MRAPPPYFLIGKSCPLALHEDKCFLKLALTGRKWSLRPRGPLLPSLCENSVQLSRTASFYPCLLVLVPQLPTPSEAHVHRQANRHLLIPSSLMLFAPVLFSFCWVTFPLSLHTRHTQQESSQVSGQWHTATLSWLSNRTAWPTYLWLSRY